MGGEGGGQSVLLITHLLVYPTQAMCVTRI